MLLPVQTAAEPPRLPHDRDNPRQWVAFVYGDGREVTSREINWRNVDLHALVEIRAHLKGEVWSLRRQDCPSTFVEFVHFRQGGSDLRVVREPGQSERVEIIPHNSIHVGWTDGATEYLDALEWKTGRHLLRYTLPRDYRLHRTHFHPQSRTVPRA